MLSLALRLGWRNLWRNGKRTAITAAAIAFGTFVMIASGALMLGLVRQWVDNATNLATGEAQLHAPRYLAERSFYQTLPDAAGALRAAAAASVPAAARAYGFGLVSRGSKSAGASFWGVDPAVERATFDLPRQLQRGSYLPDLPAGPAPEGARPLVLGAKLARSLDAEVGAEIIAVVQAGDGSLGNELFRVVGVLKTAGETIDRSAAIVRRDDFALLFAAPGVVHEVAFHSRGRIPPEQLAGRLGDAALAGGELRTWRQLLPMLSDLEQVTTSALVVMGLIFFLAAGLGVLNTMLMATYERIREFGVQKALGTTPGRILLDVATEAWLLGGLASVPGGLLGTLLAAYLQAHGLDMSRFASSFSASGVAIDPVWQASLSGPVVVVPVLAMWGVTVLAALYPAFKAARIQAVRAMAHH